MADSAFRINRGITLNPQTAAPSNPTNGDVYYDSTQKSFALYDNGFWINLASRADVASASSLTSANFTAAIVANSLVRITGATTTNIHGLTASTGGKSVVIYNQSTATVTIKNQSGTEGTAANRITTVNAADVTLTAGQTITLSYDDGASTWFSASSPGSGSGSSSGSEKDLNDTLFRASFVDEFTESSASTATAVDGAAGKTNATYSANGGVKPTGGGYYQMSYDASKTVTGTTVNMTLSGTPAFTVVAGDMLIVTGEARRIATVNTQTSYVIESAFTVTPSPSATAATVSQAVHTKDIYNLTLGDNAIATAFPATTFSEIMVDYEDSTGTVSGLDVAPIVGYTASADGTTFSAVQLRPTLETDTLNSLNLPAAGSALYIRLFANKSSGTGTVDVLRYQAWMQKIASNSSASGAYGVFNSAYGFTNGVGTPVNCSFSVSGGKTLVTLTNSFTYAVGVSSGAPYGSLDVYLNGQLIPRFINATLTPDGSYLETSPTVLTLDKDYSALNVSVEVLQRTTIVDTSTQNTTNISNLQVVPSVQRILTGSGTYTTPTSPRVPRYIKVRMVGGGAGGTGAGNTNNGGTGGTGGNTTFGSSLLTANGGAGVATGAGSGGGIGGTVTVNSPAVSLVALQGGNGNGGNTFPATNPASGGNGGVTPFGGAGGGSFGITVGGNAIANSGSGGGGAGINTFSGAYSGGGGGAGGYIEAIISSPSATYSYAIGAGGTAGAAGTSGAAGGTGASGIIIVEEFY